VHISPMREEHLEQMVELDLLAFNREKPRLLESGGVNGHGPPLGCHVVLDNEQVRG
jgi:hypothetical protein